VHRDDHNVVKQQLNQLQLENARLVAQLSLDSKDSKDPNAAEDVLRIQQNNRKILRKNCGTQTHESFLESKQFSLLDIKNMIVGILPGVQDDIEQFMAALCGASHSEDSGHAAPAHSSQSPATSSPSSPLASPGARLGRGDIDSPSGSAGDLDSSDLQQAGLKKLFGFLKQSVDKIIHEVGRSSAVQSPSSREAGTGKHLKSVHAVAKHLKSVQHSDEDDADVSQSDREMFAYFKTSGSGKDVPVHLRTNIKMVKNRFFSKRECENLVHQIWKSKVKPTRHSTVSNINQS
jgi:hypothetical protein